MLQEWWAVNRRLFSKEEDSDLLWKWRLQQGDAPLQEGSVCAEEEVGRRVERERESKESDSISTLMRQKRSRIRGGISGSSGLANSIGAFFGTLPFSSPAGRLPESVAFSTSAPSQPSEPCGDSLQWCAGAGNTSSMGRLANGGLGSEKGRFFQAFVEGHPCRTMGKPRHNTTPIEANHSNFYIL